MFYIKKNNIKFSKKINNKKNDLSIEQKVKLSTIMYVYLNDENVVGFKKRYFKKWFKKNKKEILEFFTEEKEFLLNFKNSEFKKSLTKLFDYDLEKIKQIMSYSIHESDDSYDEFLKVNDNLYFCLDFLREHMDHNFNEMFKYINILIFPEKKGQKWK